LKVGLSRHLEFQKIKFCTSKTNQPQKAKISCPPYLIFKFKKSACKISSAQMNLTESKTIKHFRKGGEIHSILSLIYHAKTLPTRMKMLFPSVTI
jgi:hypothetical protein